VNPVTTVRLSRILQGDHSGRAGFGSGGRWELPLLAAIAAFILALGSGPFVAPAAGWRFMQAARFDWVASATTAQEDVRSVPLLQLTEPKADGDYSYTPDLTEVTMHLVRPSSWSRYVHTYLGGNVDAEVSSDDAIIDDQSARGLHLAVGDDVVILFLSAAEEVKPVRVRIGAILASSVEPGAPTTGLVAITGRRLGAAAVAKIAPGGQGWRFGTGSSPPGARTRISMRDSYLSALVAAGAGPATTGTVLLGALLWWIALARYARRLLEHDRRATALMVTLGSRPKAAAAVAALPVLAVAGAAILVGTLLARWVIFTLIEERAVSVLALVPLGGFMAATSGLAAYRTYRGVHARSALDRLARTLMEDS